MILHPRAKRFIKAKKVPLATILFIAVATCFAEVQASRSNGSVAVSAIVKNRCTTDTDVSFQTSQRTAKAHANTAGEVSVHCSMHMPYSVSVNAGQGDDASDTGALAYDLYSDPQHTAPWGKGIGPHELSGTYAATRPPVTLYGRSPAEHAEHVAHDTNVLTVTVDY